MYAPHFPVDGKTLYHIAVFPILAGVVKVKKGSGSTAHWSIDFIRLSGWLRRCFTLLITPLDIDRIGQNWEDSNIILENRFPVAMCRLPTHGQPTSPPRRQQSGQRCPPGVALTHATAPSPARRCTRGGRAARPTAPPGTPPAPAPAVRAPPTGAARPCRC